MRGAGGFRNVLVHEYLKVDLREVVRMLREAPGLFRRFGEEVRDWLSRGEKSRGELG